MTMTNRYRGHRSAVLAGPLRAIVRREVVETVSYDILDCWHKPVSNDNPALRERRCLDCAVLAVKK